MEKYWAGAKCIPNGECKVHNAQMGTVIGSKAQTSVTGQMGNRHEISAKGSRKYKFYPESECKNSPKRIAATLTEKCGGL